jgi:class 3 adenylate cyclase
MATGLPAGTVTFLFADVEGSTQLLRSLGNRYADVLADQRRLFRTILGEEAFAAGWAAGRAMPLEDAIEFGLGRGGEEIN